MTEKTIVPSDIICIVRFVANQLIYSKGDEFVLLYSQLDDSIRNSAIFTLAVSKEATILFDWELKSKKTTGNFYNFQRILTIYTALESLFHEI